MHLQLLCGVKSLIIIYDYSTDCESGHAVCILGDEFILGNTRKYKVHHIDSY